MTTLNIRALHKSYGQVEVLRDFDLEIAEGEFVSLLGPSGCGKTTTLRCVAGFEFPNQGTIHFGGEDMTWLPPERRDVGMVFQSYALFPHLTVHENLAFGLEMRKAAPSEIERRVASVLEMVQLTGMDKRFPRELSGGQQQRVALARALVIEPSVLLLDEPLANLDAALRDDMRFFIRELQQRVGITAIYVTHDQSEAIVMSDRIVVMFDGRIAQLGTPREIHDRPANRRVAEFVGRSNFIDGVVAESAGEDLWQVTTGVGQLVASGSSTLSEGTKVRVLVRPEYIRLGVGEPGWNALPATIADAVYVGDAVTLDIRLSDDSPLRLDVRPDTQVAPGDRIDISFPPDNGWILS